MKYIKKFIACAAIFYLVMLMFPVRIHAASVEQVEYENIGIGAGGAFFEPLINPMDSNNYIVFSDMNNIYCSYDAGNTWESTITKTSFHSACFSEDEVLFLGGDGLYVSDDKGENIDLIYPHPSTVKASVSILGRNDDNIKAEGYVNDYVVCLQTYKNRLYFVTIEWSSSRNLRLFSCDYNGENLEQLYYLENAADTSPLNLNYQMVVDDTGIFYSDGEKIWCYDFATSDIFICYEAQGILNDFKKIEQYYFLLDDTEEETAILYTKDFVSFEDLSKNNTLSKNFSRYGETFTFEWHFRYISGKDLEHIFLNHYSSVDWGEYSGNNIGGIMKYDGKQFSWVYDAINYNHATFSEVGWGYHNYNRIYGMCIDPNDGNHCIVTDVSTVYDMHYGEGEHSVRTVHSNITQLDGVEFESTTGLDCQTTYRVREDPFNSDHILICSADLGIQISYDGGKSFRRMETTYQAIENTCYDVYFDSQIEGKVYSIWSSRHDAPYTVPVLSDAYATGGFAVSYDGGITWDRSYSTGLPENSIPIRMHVIETETELIIGVATYNNGFYISYDSGVTFTDINANMYSYNGMIFGEDIKIIDNFAYCLTSYHTLSDELTPSALYKVNLETGETVQIELGDIVIARTLTYDEQMGLYLNVLPYYTYDWIEEIQGYYFINYGGGVYQIEDDVVTHVLEIENGASDSAFDADNTMYVSADKGIVYVKEYYEDDFRIYVNGLHKRLKNISFSNDSETMYIGTLGGGTYRMSTLEVTPVTTKYTVTFENWDGTVLSTQTVAEGGAAVLPETPTREPDADYHYTFSKWSESTDYIDSDLTVTARFVYKSHTGTIKNTAEATCTGNSYTGDNICSSCEYVIEAGEVIPATGHTDGSITQNGDDTHNVYCSVCEEEIRLDACTDTDGDGYCDVCRSKCRVYYTVTFVDWDGTVLSTQAVLEGEDVFAPSDLTRESDTEGSYTFTGWDSDLTDIQSDLTVTAVYTFTAHIGEIQNIVDPTCTTGGYTGDVYCTNCGMLMETGETVSMIEHTYNDAVANNDGTHNFNCTECDAIGPTADCEDVDIDGYCDICGYTMNVTKFTKVTSFTNGEQYLLVGSGYALSRTLASESVSLTVSDSYYTTADDISDDLLWTYDNGRLYMTYNGTTYYLTVRSGYNSYAITTITTITTNWWANTWTYSNGSLYTQTTDWFRRTTKYLYITNSTAALSTTSSSITLYQLES